MSATNAKPKAEPFVMMPRSLLQSDAWRSLGINGRRVIDFLMLEHMRHGGQGNGNLKAPRQQLHAFGIGTHFVSPAIAAAEERGLIRCNRGGMRVATTYALTWLPTADGAAPSNDWRAYRDPDLQPLPAPKSKNLTAKQQSGLGAKQQSDAPNLTAKQQSDRSQGLGAKQQHPYRSPLTREPELDSVCRGAGGAAVVAFPAAAVKAAQ